MSLLRICFCITLTFIFCQGVEASNAFHSTASPVDLHNKALKKLEAEDKTLAVILFRKNFYENLFFPSYLALKSRKEEVSLAPFAQQVMFLAFALLSLICLVFSLKQALALKRNFKILTLWFCGLTILFSSGFFNLKKRVTNLEELDLLQAPFEEALSLEKIKKGSDLIFLKKQGEWLQVKTSQQQKGWLLEADLIKTLE